MTTETLLKQYHPIFLTRSEVKEIFDLSEHQLFAWRRKYKWRKAGHKFLRADIEATLAEFLQEEVV
ncbi:hypothetical protein OAN03_02940 [Opitutales bacterium]|nr:hypothetical protein [Opitutales bacterium]